MNNYEYIIAGLPVFQQDCVKPDGFDADGMIYGIKELCDSKDVRIIDFLLKGYDAENLNEEFYRVATSHKNRFVKNYFSFDLNVRNAKAEYLNVQLGRPVSQDTIVLSAEDEKEDDSEMKELKSVLCLKDLLKREKGLDTLYWNKVDSLTIMDVFSIDVILAFIVKLKILDRWFKIDPQTGRLLLKRMVETIRKTKEI